MKPGSLLISQPKKSVPEEKALLVRLPKALHQQIHSL